MIEYSQAILLVTTTLVVVSTIAYLGAFFAVRMSRAPVATAATESAGTVVINAGDGDRTVAVTGASVTPPSSGSPSPGGPPSPRS